MKLAHIILLASAGARTVLGAGAVAEKSAVSLGPHFSQAASELLDLYPAQFGSGDMLHLRMCRDGNYLPGSCYDIVMGMLLAGEDRVRNVTLECEIKCRRFPDYHCFDTCKRAKLDEVYDGEIAHSLHLLREMLGMRKMTTLERCGLGFQYPFKTWSHGKRRFYYALAGASMFYLLSLALYYKREHPGTPETIRSGLLWGSIICSLFSLFFVGMATHKLLTAGGGALGGALVSAIISGNFYLYYILLKVHAGGGAGAPPQPMKAVLLVGCLFFAFLGSIFLGSASQKLFAYVISVDKSEESATA